MSVEFPRFHCNSNDWLNHDYYYGDFNNADCTDIPNFFYFLEWTELVQDLSHDSILEAFYNALDYFTELFKKMSARKFKRWCSKERKDNINEKKKARWIYRIPASVILEDRVNLFAAFFNVDSTDKIDMKQVTASDYHLNIGFGYLCHSTKSQYQ